MSLPLANRPAQARLAAGLRAVRQDPFHSQVGAGFPVPAALLREARRSRVRAAASAMPARAAVFPSLAAAVFPSLAAAVFPLAGRRGQSWAAPQAARELPAAAVQPPARAAATAFRASR